MIKNERNFILVGLGELLWDLLPGGKQVGGAPANFAYHAEVLGGRGVVVSCVGDDELGKELMRRLRELGLDCQYVAVDKDHPTGKVTVKLDGGGEPNYTIHENVAWDFIPLNSSALNLAARADAVCFGSLCQRSEVSRKTIGRFLATTRPDCLRVFDINLRQSYFNREIIHESLGMSNVLKLNDEELPMMADLLGMTGSETDILSRLTERYALRLIALTRGGSGSRLYAQREESNHRGFSVKIADTVGAGDSFSAAMTVGLLYGKALDKINEYANRVASFVCSQRGATPKLPDSIIQAVQGVDKRDAQS